MKGNLHRLTEYIIVHKGTSRNRVTVGCAFFCYHGNCILTRRKQGMKKDHLKLAGAILIISLLAAGCGASKTEPAPAKQEEQAQVAEAPAAEEPAAEEPAAEEPQEPATTEVMPAPESGDQQSEPQNEPEEEAIPEGSEINESELEDGTKSTEIIKPDGSIRLVLEAPDGSRTETDYDPQLYPQSKVVYDEEGNKKSETTYKYDENQLDKSWESTTEYDEEGNIEFTSETENVYPQEEGFIYGAEPATGPDKVYPDPTGKGYKYGTELLPTTSETVVKDAQGEVVKTISVDNEKLDAMVEYPDGSYEHYSKIKIFNEKYEVITSIQINYYNPYGERYKMVAFDPGWGRQEVEYDPSGSVIGKHYYREDGTQSY